MRGAPDTLVVLDEAYAAYAGRDLRTWLDRFENVELTEPMPVPAHDASFFLRPLTVLPLKLTPRR